MRKIILKAVLILIGSLLLAVPTLAGGWAVVTLDALPDEPKAGEPMAIGFVIRQHGKEPVSNADPTVSAFNAETGERLRVEAQKGKEIGHYVAEITFPSEGVWEWSISDGLFHEMVTLPPLNVLPAETGAALIDQTALDNATETVAAPDAPTAISTRVLLRWFAAALLIAALVLAVVDMRQRRGRQALAVGASGSD